LELLNLQMVAARSDSYLRFFQRGRMHCGAD
jgi:hypothetical protein